MSCKEVLVLLVVCGTVLLCAACGGNPVVGGLNGFQPPESVFLEIQTEDLFPVNGVYESPAPLTVYVEPVVVESEANAERSVRGVVRKYEIDFGDDTVVDATSVLFAFDDYYQGQGSFPTQIAMHTYTTPGFYTPRAIVTLTDGSVMYSPIDSPGNTTKVRILSPGA